MFIFKAKPSESVNIPAGTVAQRLKSRKSSIKGNGTISSLPKRLCGEGGCLAVSCFPKGMEQICAAIRGAGCRIVKIQIE